MLIYANSVASPLLTGQILERIATEFNQLQFHAVQSKGMPLLDKLRPVSMLPCFSKTTNQLILIGFSGAFCLRVHAFVLKHIQDE